LVTPSDQITAYVYVIPLAEQAHPLAPWLYRIATNCALNFLKKQPGSRMLSPQRRIEQEYEKRCTSYQEPVDQSMLIENQYVMRESLQEALRRLSAEDAACLVLRFVAGERYAEIAQRLGLSTEAVRKRVTRGILVFRAAYQELDAEVMHDR
jgi:RNA polymerase sigma-70 factor (ECF subfamily)